MTDFAELERLAREANTCEEAWPSSGGLLHSFSDIDAAYIAACSPEVVLRLLSIARAAEKVADDDLPVEQLWRDIAALREALKKPD